MKTNLLIRILFLASALAALPCAAGAAYLLSIPALHRGDAEMLHQRLATNGYPVYMLYGEDCEIRLGGYDTREKAQQVMDRLKAEEKIVARIIEEESIDQGQFSWETPSDPGKEVDGATVTGYADERAKRIIALGLDLFGQPYKYGGTTIGKGIDCSFFTKTIFKELGIDLPRTSGEQFKVGSSVSRPSLQVGDLVFFQQTAYVRKKKRGRRVATTHIGHVGIYIGNGEFIHAALGAKRVTISRLDENYYVKRYAGARRVLVD